jgi:hypothetical protein
VQTFAIRFKDAELAGVFKAAFQKAQDDNKKFISGADASEGSKEADELAKVTENLSVGK